MPVRFGSLMIGAGVLLATTSALVAQQCTAPTPPQRLSADDLKTVVINDPAVLRGPVDFSLGRTLGAILNSASPGSDTPANREALLESMLASFKATSLTNKDSGLSFALTLRPGEAALKASALLTPDDKDGMQVVGLFNRLDLAPASYQNCGEYRIVYEKKSAKMPPTVTPAFNDRLTMIFEAALPNPDPNGSSAGCRPVAEFWSGLRSKSGADLSKALEGLYYKGDAKGDGTTFYEPVVHYAHYGSPAGQVRANAFTQPGSPPAPLLPWHLRQWHVERDATNMPSFVAEPVNENAAPALYGGPSTGITPSGDFDRLKGFFQNEFVRASVAQLTTGDTAAAVARVPMPESNLVSGIGVDINDVYYTLDSAAAASDDPQAKAANTDLPTRITAQLKDTKLDALCGLTADHLLNRAGAMSCGGCHQFSNDKDIAPGITWPRSLNFVHINEQSELSNLLLDRFLPSRKANLDEFLAKPVQTLDALSIKARSNVVQASSISTRLANAQRVQSTTSLEDFNALQSFLAAARTTAKKEPGAFVVSRRTH